MDSDTVDREYSTLQNQAQQTANLIQALAAKLSSAAAAGDVNAREWALDLKEIALAVREEESGATTLLQAIHALVDNHVQGNVPPTPPVPSYQQAPAYPAASYQQAPAYPQQMYAEPAYAPPAGGTLQRFLGSGFGRAIATGAGFGIGDDVINSIFNRL